MRYFLYFMLIVLLSGCSAVKTVSYQEVLRAYDTVKFSDGITQDEAKIIAQNYLIQKGLTRRVHSLIPIGTDKWILWEKDGEYVRLVDAPSPTFQQPVIYSWVVLFRDKGGSYFSGRYPVVPLYVEVDLKTGNVRNWGLYDDTKK